MSTPAPVCSRRVAPVCRCGLMAEPRGVCADDVAVVSLFRGPPSGALYHGTSHICRRQTTSSVYCAQPRLPHRRRWAPGKPRRICTCRRACADHTLPTVCSHGCLTNSRRLMLSAHKSRLSGPSSHLQHTQRGGRRWHHRAAVELACTQRLGVGSAVRVAGRYQCARSWQCWERGLARADGCQRCGCQGVSLPITTAPHPEGFMPCLLCDCV